MTCLIALLCHPIFWLVVLVGLALHHYYTQEPKKLTPFQRLLLLSQQPTANEPTTQLPTTKVWRDMKERKKLPRVELEEVVVLNSKRRMDVVEFQAERIHPHQFMVTCRLQDGERCKIATYDPSDGITDFQSPTTREAGWIMLNESELHAFACFTLYLREEAKHSNVQCVTQKIRKA